MRSGRSSPHAINDLLYDNSLVLAFDSCNFITSLSPKLNSVEKSIRVDVNVIGHEFERRRVCKIIWVSGKVNLSDPATKIDSPLVDVLCLTLQDGSLPFSFPALERCSSNHSID